MEAKKGFEAAVQHATGKEVCAATAAQARLNCICYSRASALELHLTLALPLLFAVAHVHVCQDYKFGDGTKTLIGSTKQTLQKLGRALGVVPDFEANAFQVPVGCRRFVLRQDAGDGATAAVCLLSSLLLRCS